MISLLRYFTIFIVAIALCLPVKAVENDKIDSLLKILKERPFDTSSLEELNTDIKQCLYNNPDLAISQAKKIIASLDAESQYQLITLMELNIGIGWDLKGQYDSAIQQYDKALHLAQKNNLITLEADIYNNYGIVYAYLGQMERSLDYGLKALKIYDQTNDSSRLAKIYNNLGSRYSEMGMNDKALEYYDKAVAINQLSDDKRRLSYNYGNIGTIYSDMDQNEMALDFYMKSFQLQKTLDNKVALSITLGNMAIAYQHLKQYDLALDYANQAYTISNKMDDEIGKLTYFITCAKIYFSREQYSKSLECYNKAEALSDSIDARQNLLEVYKGKAELFATIQDFENAYIYNEKYNTVSISLLDSEKDKAMKMIQEYDEIKSQNEIELLTKDSEIQKLNLRRQKVLRNSIAGIGVLILVLAIGLGHRYRYVRRTRNELAKKNKTIESEKQKSDDLLLNILPEETAEELKSYGKSKARSYEMTTVLFTDFKGFTKIAELLSPEELVQEVDHCFKAFDQIISKYNIEKIKTIGDAYMCAGGLPIQNESNPLDVVNAGLDMVEFTDKLRKQREADGKPFFEVRVGIHTGPVVAGIVGVKKFAYDIWGDTVNIAARMESSGEVGKVNISESTFQYVKEHFQCKHRGKVEAKNKGAIDMYFVNRKENPTNH